MSSRNRSPLRVAGSVALAALMLSAVGLAPASGQIDGDDVSDLEARRDELTVRISELDVAIAEVDAEIDELEGSVDRAEVALELLADEFERLVDERRGPERLRTEIAVAGYVTGDPRRNALLDEFETIRGDTANPAERRRQFYSAIVEEAEVRLAAIDEQLRGLADQVDEARSDTDELETRRGEARTEREELGGERTTLALELDEIVNRLELLKSLENTALLTGLPTISDPTRPALVVKIDNVGPALPQAGINQADVVFEELVEGGFSRLAAVFHSEAPEVVGPIRSMRTSDIDLLSQLNSPLFANSGGNRVTSQMVSASTLIDIGAGRFPGAYYRDTSRSRPANLFANAGNLWTAGASDEAAAIGSPGQPFPLWPFREVGSSPHPDAVAASGVDIDFSSTQVSYDWDGTGWARSQNGDPHVDAAGVRVAPTNVIVQITGYGVSQADGRSPHAFTVGTNPAWILSDGTVVEATWRRDSATDTIQYVDSDGQPVPLAPGRTWVALVPKDSAVIR